MKVKKEENVIFLNTASAIRYWDANKASEIYRACEEKGVELTEQFEELLKLLQVPEIAQSMFSRFLEVKIIFSPQIKEFFNE